MYLLEKLPKVKNFCWCMSLNTGCLFIGYLELLSNSIGIINSARNNDYDYEDLFFYYLFAGFLLIINALLVYGVHQQKARFTLPWIIGKFICYIGFTFVYFYKIIDSIYLIMDIMGENKLFYLIIIIDLILTLLILLCWHSVTVVYSYYFKAILIEKSTEDKKKTK